MRVQIVPKYLCTSNVIMCLENSEVHSFYTFREQFPNEIIYYKMLKPYNK